MHKILTQIFVFQFIYMYIYIINIKYIYENLCSNTYRNITLFYIMRYARLCTWKNLNC